MPIKVIRWSPDTCECVLEYEYDTEDTKPNKTYTGRSVITACQRHDGAANPNSTFGQVKADNNAKNNTLKVLFDNYPELRITDEEGGEKLDRTLVQTFLNLNRVIEVTISEPSFDAAKKAEALGLIETALGDSDKVIIL